MRIIVYGQAPSRSGDPDQPLGGDHYSARRLADLAGLSQAQMEAVFDRRNLLRDWPGSMGEKGDAFPIDRARAVAETERLGWPPNAEVILLGRSVARAFGLGHVGLLSSIKENAHRVTVFPHPSGISCWWNYPGNREAARAVLRQVVQRVLDDAGSSL